MSIRPAFRRAELSALLLLVLLALLPRPAAASWPSDPSVNVALSTATAGQRYPSSAPDGTGGAIVAWDDQRSGPRDIYAQRVDGTGAVRWTADGVPLCTATGEQYEPAIIADGSGGAIVVWLDFRGGGAFDIYAQRVDSTGTAKWAANGVAICAATNFQEHPAIVSDGSGGAIITWDDSRSGISRIYAQRVNGSGAPQWTANGVAVTNSLSGQARPVIIANGAGGAILAWEDYRNAEVDLFAQRILSTGAIDPAWPAGGRAFALGWADQGAPVLALDGTGGAFVAWAQWNGASRDIFGHHLLVSGVLDPAWPAGGKVVFADFGYDQTSPAIVADGAGGAIVSWDDQRTTARDVYAQHILVTGALDPAWPAGGRALCGADGIQADPRMISDGAGGAIVVWQDERDGDRDLYAQHVTNTGELDPAWPADGRAISNAAPLQVLHSIVPNGAGGAVIVWNRDPDTSYKESDVYAQLVKGNGQLGDEPVGVPDEGPVALALEAPSPNPTTAGSLWLRFTLPNDTAASLELFDVAGRRIVSREVGSLGAGQHAVDLAAGRRPGTGVYFVRLMQGSSTRVRRVVVVDE